MENSTKQVKRPAHELIPVLIAWLDDRRNKAKDIGARMAFEIMVEKTCQMTGMMIIPEQHLPDLLRAIQAIGLQSDSYLVQQSIADLAAHLLATSRIGNG